VGVVNHRGDEIGSEYESPVFIDAPNSRVVAGFRADDQAIGSDRCETAHNVSQLAGGELAGSTGAVAVLRES